MANFFKKLLNMGADKDLKRFEKIAAHVNEIEPTYTAMSDEELAACTPAFRERVERGESLDAILPEAFAVDARGLAARARACATSTSRSSAPSRCTRA